MESSNATIDDLHENILLRILSFFPTTIAAAQASAISPRWRNLWHSLRTLHFDISEFLSRFPDGFQPDARQLFAELIIQALSNRPPASPVEKFRLRLDYRVNASIISCIGSWTRYVISRKAEELDLIFDDVIPYYVGEAEQDYKNYCFDFSLLVDSSVEVLKLHGCTFRMPAPEEFPIRVACLKAFHFYGDGICILVIDEDVCNLISTCVNLEILSIENVWGYENLNIVSPKLKELKLSLFRLPKIERFTFEICAPSLQSISLSSFYMGKYTLKDTLALIEAQVEFGNREKWEDFACWSNVVSSLHGVERLSVQNMWIWKESVHDKWEQLESDEESVDSQDKSRSKLLVAEEVFSEAFAFNNLKHLELLTGYTRNDILGIEALLGKCPLLKSMVLQYSYRRDGDDNSGEEIMKRPVIFQMQCLRLVRMKNYRGAKGELYVVKLLKEHRVALEKIVAFPAKVGETLPPPLVLWPTTLDNLKSSHLLSNESSSKFSNQIGKQE